MIREFQRDDINKVADIWLDTNIKAHNFISAEYWKSNFKSVKEALLLADVYKRQQKSLLPLRQRIPPHMRAINMTGIAVY